MRNYESLVAEKRWTELLDALPVGKSTGLRFDDCRSMDSFKSVATRQNMRGEDVRFSLSMDYRQRFIIIKKIEVQR